MLAEKRRAPRVKAILSIDYSVEAQDLNLFYVTSDISRKGVFIRTSSPLDEGTRVELLISLESPTEAETFVERIILQGVVTHVRRKGKEAGMGVHFEELSEDEWKRIESYISKKRKGHGELSLLAPDSKAMKDKLNAIGEQSRQLQNELDDYHKDFGEDPSDQ